MQRKASNCRSIKWKQLIEMPAAFHYKESPNDWIILPQYRHYQGKKDYEGHLNQEIWRFYLNWDLYKNDRSLRILRGGAGIKYETKCFLFKTKSHIPSAKDRTSDQIRMQVSIVDHFLQHHLITFNTNY